MDASLDLMVAAGGSTATDEELQDLQGGHHDPRKRGFTLQQAELRLSAAVDPYFDAVATFVTALEPLTNETSYEVEEAWLRTRELPEGLTLFVGQLLTRFGRKNQTHPHTWDWLDQPVINTRLFGGDGMRGLGASLAWTVPASWTSDLHASVQDANGETMVSFLSNEEAGEERPIGGRPWTDRQVHSLGDLVWGLRWTNQVEVDDENDLHFGLSGLYGPNASGPSGWTAIYGLDLEWQWAPPDAIRKTPSWRVRTEIMGRTYAAARYEDLGDPGDPGDDVLIGADTLHDRGGYLEVLHGFAVGWDAGLRLEYATGSGGDVDPATGSPVDRQDDPYRDDRYRVSPLLAYRPTEFSHIRLQYAYDHADHLTGGEAHSVWLGFEVLIGSHPAHGW
ncbi:MAG: hypothetical protein R3F30_06745 [Planctomycetota bacterium]